MNGAPAAMQAAAYEYRQNDATVTPEHFATLYQALWPATPMQHITVEQLATALGRTVNFTAWAAVDGVPVLVGIVRCLTDGCAARPHPCQALTDCGSILFASHFSHSHWFEVSLSLSLLSLILSLSLSARSTHDIPLSCPLTLSRVVSVVDTCLEL